MLPVNNLGSGGYIRTNDDKLEVCYPSCYWRKGERCVFRSKRGRRILELTKRRK